MPGQTILLVEDSPTDALIVKHALRNCVGVEHVRSPRDAQERLRNARYAAVVTDYCLPYMDGLHLQKWIAEQGLDVPVIVMSGHGDERVAAEALKSGAYDYVVKSEESLASLGVVIQQALRRHELEQRAQLLQQIVENASDAIVTMQMDGVILTANQAIKVIFGYSQEEAVGKPLQLLFPSDKNEREIQDMLASGASGRSWQGELTARRSNGSFFPVHMSCSVLRDPGSRARHLIGIARDVTERRQLLDKLKRLSITDNLTGLFNHRLFHDRLKYEFERARRYGSPLGCIMIDVDFFKTVNDTYGHLMGDEVLRSLAGFISRATRSVDITARYGGEEFAILLPNTDLAGTLRCAEHIWETIGTSEIPTQQGALRLTVSAGVAALSEDVKDEEELCRRADAALLAAKRNGRNHVRAWDDLASDGEDDARIPGSQNLKELLANLARLIAPAKRRYIGSVRPLLESAAHRDPVLQRHTANVTIFAMELARAAGVKPEEVDALHNAALFHVIGRVFPPVPSPLPAAREKKGFTLPVRPEDSGSEGRVRPEGTPPAPGMCAGEDLVLGMSVLSLEREYARHCGERYDGGGYPDGLAGKSIPLGARILAVAVAYDALITDERDGKGMAEKEAIHELRRAAGTRLDPDLVGLFTEMRAAELKT